MNNNFGSIHKLHLLRFNSINNSKSGVSAEKSKLFDSVCFFNGNKKLKPQTDNIIAENPLRGKQHSTSETTLRNNRPAFRNNAINRSFYHSYFGLLNRSCRKRSASLHDLKRKLSNNLLLSNRIKRKMQAVTAKYFVEYNKNKRQKNGQVKKNKKSDNIKVLFPPRKRVADNALQNRNISSDCRRLDIFYDSKSSGDCYGSHSNNNNPYFCYELFKSNNNDPFHTCYCNTDPYVHDYMDRGKYRLQCADKLNFDNTTPVHYRLLDFPHDTQRTMTELNANKMCSYRAPTANVCPCTRKNKQIYVTPSCFSIRKTGAGDFDSVPGCTLTPKIEVLNKCKMLPKSKDIILKTSLSKNCHSPKLSLGTVHFSESPMSQVIKTSLKYTLFCIAVLVWFPCIVTVGLLWLIIYPLQPQHVFKDINHADDPYSNIVSGSKCGQTFWQSVFRPFVCLTKNIKCSYNAMCCSLKTQKQKYLLQEKPCPSRSFSVIRNPHCKRRRQQYPNPKKKYSLYYTPHKGWVMKPLRKRRKSAHKHCEYHPIDFRDTVKKTEINRDQVCECHFDDINNVTDLSEKCCKKSLYKKYSTSLSDHNKPSNETSRKCSLNDCIKDRSEKGRCNDSVKLSPINRNYVLEAHNKSPCEPLPIRGLQTCKTHVKSTINSQPFATCRGPMRKFSKSVSFKQNMLKYVDKPHCIPPLGPYNYYKKEIALPRRRPIMRSPDKPPCLCPTVKRICKSRRPMPPKPKVTKCRKKSRKLCYKEYENEGQSVCKRRKLCCWGQCVKKKIRIAVNDIEDKTWKYDICDNMYIYTLRRRPCFWIYTHCPSYYPYFLIFYKFYANLIHGMMFVISTCIWCPILCWCYFCFTLFCRCIH